VDSVGGAASARTSHERSSDGRQLELAAQRLPGGALRDQLQDRASRRRRDARANEVAPLALEGDRRAIELESKPAERAVDACGHCDDFDTSLRRGLGGGAGWEVLAAASGAHEAQQRLAGFLEGAE
jgi:hypothetical protein